MKKLTQAEIILKTLRDNHKWFYSYELIKVNTPYGWLGSGSDRCARSLAEEGKIERRHEGKYAEYRAKELQPKQVYKVVGRDITINTY